MNRERICTIIRALRAKTVANGCTEDEALAAAAKAAEMLERYNLTVDEVELRETPFKRHTEQHDDEVGRRLWKVAAAISELTGARYWTSRPGQRVEVSFFGFEHEVDVARYLLEICARAMRDQEAALMRQHALLRGRARLRIVMAYLDGMADRLAERILELVPPPVTGTGLVVVRDALIRQAMKDEGIDLGEQDARRSRDFDPAYIDGRQAAERVALNRGVRGGRGSLLLLG